MGTWFRDYVYFPLGGSRVKSKKRMVFNLFVVWILTGIWHGANWTFLIWGIMYFILITLEKVTDMSRKMNWFGHIWTMFFVIIGWVIFRSDTMAFAIKYIKVMLGGSMIGFIGTNALSLLKQFGLFLGIGIFLTVFNVEKIKIRNQKINYVGYIAAYTMMMFLSICAIVKGGNDPFIYFNF